MTKTPKETSVLIAFQKLTATWDLKMEDIPQLAAQDLKTTCLKKKKNINTAHIATIEYYTLHVIYNMNGTQVMSAISNHDFNTKPYVKVPQYDKTFSLEKCTHENTGPYIKVNTYTCNKHNSHSQTTQCSVT